MDVRNPASGALPIPMRRIGIVVCLVAGALVASLSRAQENTGGLRAPADFASMADVHARSLALFAEAAKVITDPRCMNCHPAGDRPVQGDDAHVHFPHTARGPDGGGVPGLPCSTCHADTNVTLLAAPERSIPGHPRWELAPKEMAWEGRTPSEICAQLKDPARNGGRTLALLHEHMAHDDLVAWGWNPGAGRRPAPGSQAQLGALIGAWIETGAACP